MRTWSHGHNKHPDAAFKKARVSGGVKSEPAPTKCCLIPPLTPPHTKKQTEAVSQTAGEHIWQGLCNHISTQLYDHMKGGSKNTRTHMHKRAPVQQLDEISISLNGRQNAPRPAQEERASPASACLCWQSRTEITRCYNRSRSFKKAVV